VTSVLDKLPVPVWFARVAIFIIVCGFFSVPIYQFIRPQLALDQHGVITSGHIVSLEPQNHSGIRYTYRVGGANYTRSWGPWRGVEEARVGDSIDVTYLPDDPGTSIPGKPDVSGWWVLPFVVLPGMAGLASFLGLRRWRTAR
jgi:hypothetical protein